VAAIYNVRECSLLHRHVKYTFYTTKLNTPTVRSRDGVLPASFGVKYNMGYGIGKSGALCLPMRLSYCTGDKISTEGIQ
jgi:hypothetical protein